MKRIESEPVSETTADEDAPEFRGLGPRANHSRRWLLATAVVVAVLVAAGVSWWATGRGENNGGQEASCAAELVLGGRTYLGRGELVRVPRSGPAAGTGRIPACRHAQAGGRAQRVATFALSGVSPKTAVLADGTVWLSRSATTLPEPLRVLYRPVRCVGSGGTVWGRLSGIDAMPQDGDYRVRTPYTATLVADRGPGLGLDEYSRVTVPVRVTGTTVGGHDPRLLRAALADGRRVVVTTHCDGSRFAATALKLAR